MTIKVRYTSIDGFRSLRSFKTLKGAQNWAQERVGETPDLGSCYAVSFDGIGKVEVVEGTTLEALFPKLAPTVDPRDAEHDAHHRADREIADRELYGDYADLGGWQEHCEYEANARYDYLHELRAEHAEDPATLAAEAAADLAESREQAQDDLEARHPTLQRPVLAPRFTYDDLPF